MRRRTANIWLFIGFFLLGGMLHSQEPADRFWSTVFNGAEFLIYAGLILSWRQSVNRRLLPTRAKGYLLAAAWLMLLFLAAQYSKYRIAVSPGLARYCWYLYYIPMLLIPTLFLMTGFRFFRGPESRKPGELWLLLPAGLLALGVLTNDLHLLAFRPNEGILHHQAFRPNEGIRGLIGLDGTYTHGVLFYAAYAWAGIALAAGIIVLMAACRKHGRWRKAVLPLGMLFFTPPVMALCKRFPDEVIPITYGWPQILMFSLLGVFEVCIRSRLIPSNENYPGFFAQMELPVLITDRALQPVYRTRVPVTATEAELRSSLDGPVCTTPDTLLLGKKIQAGCVFHTEDQSAVNRINDALQEANEVLRLENEILQREQELAAEQAGTRARSRLYQKAAQEVYPVQKKISGILDRAKPGAASFRSDIETALVLTAYVKRKANFVLTEAERGTVTAKELASAVEESCHYLRYCGMDAAAEITAQRAFPCREAMAVYDCFEAAAEALLGRTSAFFVRLRDGELLMMADCEDLPAGDGPLTGLPLPVRRSCADGQLVLRAALGGEPV